MGMRGDRQRDPGTGDAGGNSPGRPGDEQRRDDAKGQGRAETKSGQNGNKDTGGAPPPSPQGGPNTPEIPPAPNFRAPALDGPRCPHSPASGAAGWAYPRLGLRAASGCKSRSPAKRPARAAGTRQ